MCQGGKNNEEKSNVIDTLLKELQAELVLTKLLVKNGKRNQNADVKKGMRLVRLKMAWLSILPDCVNCADSWLEETEGDQSDGKSWWSDAVWAETENHMTEVAEKKLEGKEDRYVHGHI